MKFQKITPNWIDDSFINRVEKCYHMLYTHRYITFSEKQKVVKRIAKDISLTKKKLLKKSNFKYGIDGDCFYILWGKNLQDSYAIFAKTIGELRQSYKIETGLSLNTGNKYFDILMAPEKTPHDYQKCFASV